MSTAGRREKKREPPFRLVSDTISQETVECLRYLLDQAESGDVLGIAFAAMLKGRVYIVNTAGECARNRTFARGMVADLNERLSAGPTTGVE